MRIQQLFTLALTICLVSFAAPTQDDGKSPLERAREKARKAELEQAPELLSAQGKPILPGQLPAAASDEAKAAWKKVLEASGSKRPIQSFELSFYLRQRDPEHPQSNDLELRFSYLVPGFVRAELESGRTLLRGSRGDYLIDAGQEQRLMGREGIEDIKQLDQMASLARNFVSLSDPRNLRIVELTQLSAEPVGIPARYRKELDGLAWMRVVSPDFFLRPEAPPAKNAPVQLYSVALGVEPESQEIRFAVLHEQRVKVVGEERVTGLVNSTATLVKLASYARRNGFHVPHKISVFGLDPSSPTPRFVSSPTSELTLAQRNGSLRPGLSPEDFLPAEQ